MQREHVSENVYWFQSEIYAQVTAGAVTGPQWAVVIDTLAMPEETLAMRSFIEDQVKSPGTVRDQHPFPRRSLLGERFLTPGYDDRFCLMS